MHEKGRQFNNQEDVNHALLENIFDPGLQFSRFQYFFGASSYSKQFMW